ncbi:MAG: trypsin-like peptidase domain-containing protein [Planctomycetota bacterium]
MPHPIRLLSVALIAGASLLLSAPAAMAQDAPANGASSSGVDLRPSVVQIHATTREPEMTRPWTKSAPREATGSGVVIDGGRILTNAHVVEYAQRLFVQPYQSSDRLEARVIAMDTGIDLAVLTLEDPSGFEELPPATLAGRSPNVGKTVTALGYPIGGDALSITEGVVSRVEYAAYGEDTFGLQVQIDAALNPGNSGGPVVLDGEVIGLAFSGLDFAENIGYVIPTEEVTLFLGQIGDSDAPEPYEGRVQFFDWFQTTENPALRERLKLDRETTGMVCTVPEDREDNPLKKWDVITAIGPYDIGNDGLIQWDEDLRLYFEFAGHELLDEDGTVPVTLYRNGQTIEERVPLRSRRDLLMTHLKGTYPRYMVVGPMVFTPAYSLHTERLNLGFLAARKSPMAERFNSTRAFEGEELVVLASPILPHRITKDYEAQYFPTIKSVNGDEVESLEHLAELMVEHDRGFVTIEWHDQGVKTLVFDADELREAHLDILDDNGIRRAWSRELDDVLEDEFEG